MFETLLLYEFVDNTRKGEKLDLVKSKDKFLQESDSYL